MPYPGPEAPTPDVADGSRGWKRCVSEACEYNFIRSCPDLEPFLPCNDPAPNVHRSRTISRHLINLALRFRHPSSRHPRSGLSHGSARPARLNTHPSASRLPRLLLRHLSPRLLPTNHQPGLPAARPRPVSSTDWMILHSSHTTWSFCIARLLSPLVISEHIYAFSRWDRSEFHLMTLCDTVGLSDTKAMRLAP